MYTNKRLLLGFCYGLDRIKSLGEFTLVCNFSVSLVITNYQHGENIDARKSSGVLSWLCDRLCELRNCFDLTGCVSVMRNPHKITHHSPTYKLPVYPKGYSETMKPEVCMTTDVVIKECLPTAAEYDILVLHTNP